MNGSILIAFELVNECTAFLQSDLDNDDDESVFFLCRGGVCGCGGG